MIKEQRKPKGVKKTNKGKKLKQLISLIQNYYKMTLHEMKLKIFFTSM